MSNPKKDKKTSKADRKKDEEDNYRQFRYLNPTIASVKLRASPSIIHSQTPSATKKIVSLGDYLNKQIVLTKHPVAVSHSAMVKTEPQEDNALIINKPVKEVRQTHQLRGTQLQAQKDSYDDYQNYSYNADQEQSVANDSKANEDEHSDQNNQYGQQPLDDTIWVDTGFVVKYDEEK